MEKIKEIQEKIIEKVYWEVENSLDTVCVKELGEAIDMIKDLNEAMYYHSLVKAMEKNPEETMKYIYPSVAVPHMEKEVTR